MKFRRAVAGDVASVRRIHRAAIREVCSSDYPLEVIEAWLAGNRDERYLKAIREQSFWIAEERGQPLGFGGVDMANSLLESLFLDPTARGRGLAGRLLGHLEQAALSAGVHTLRLKSSITARYFYAKHGYVTEDGDGCVRLESGALLTGILMAKTLQADADRTRSDNREACPSQLPADMTIIARPSEATVRRLLLDVGLPASDIAPHKLETFFACERAGKLTAIVGLELFGAAALLRSLAVSPGSRSQGLGALLVAHAENVARASGVASLYLLTNTAVPYFARLGYRQISREAVPDAIRQTEEFTVLCPASAVLMVRNLQPEAQDRPGS